MVRRRSILGGVAGAMALAGCMDTTNTTGGNTTPTAATQLGALQVQNDDRIDHEVQIAIERDDDVVHLETYQLSAGSNNQLTGEWDGQQGAYQIHARLDDGNVQTVMVGSGMDETDGCTRILMRIGSDGALEIWTGTCN